MATLNAIYKIAADISGLQAGMDKAVQATERVETGLKKLGSNLSSAGLSVTKLFGAFSAANIASDMVSTLTAEVQELAEKGLRLPAVESSFNKLAKGVGEDSAAMLSSLQTATKGMVSEFDLMLSANKALLLGLPVTKESMADMAAAATALGRAMGIDATKSLDDLITALGRSSPMILDNLGLSVKLGEANEAMAQKLGKSADALTDAEKKMAFYEAAMEAARKKTAELGEQTKTLGEIASSVWTSIGNGITRTAGTINVGIGSALSSMKNFAEFATNAIKMGSAAAVSIQAAKAQLDAAGGAAGRFGMSGVSATNVIAPPIDQLAKYRASLDSIRTSAEKLTPAQQAIIAQAVKLGQNAEAIAKGTGLSVTAIERQIDVMKDAKKASEEHGRALKKIADDDIQRLIDSYTDLAENVKKLRIVTEGVPDGLADVGRVGAINIEKMQKAWDDYAEGVKLTKTVTAGLGDEFRDLGLTGEAEIKRIQTATQQMRSWIDDAIDVADALAFALASIGRAAGGATGQFMGMVGSAIGGYAQMMDAQQKLIQKQQAGTATWGDSARVAAGWAALVVGYVQTASAVIEALYDTLTGKEKRTAIEQRGGLVEFRRQIELTGVSFRGFSDTATGFRMQLEQFDAAIAANQRRMEAYGLTWRDFNQEIRQSQIDAFTRTLVLDLRDLKEQMGSTEAALKAMAPAFSKMVVEAVKTGTKIPAVLQPILKQLIQMKLLSEDAARALLGMADDSMPSLEDIRAAAERYGLELDQLGPKVRQLQITEIANQIVADFNLLKAAGADVGTVMLAMKDKVQALVTDALRFGLVLPESMRPLIEAMIAAGLLTDEFGKKLIDTSRINFATPLVDKIDDLIEKMSELIDKFSRVGTAAEEGFGRARGAAEKLGESMPRGAATPPTGGSRTADAAAAMSMVMGSNVVPFRSAAASRGTVLQDSIAVNLDGERLVDVTARRLVS